MKVKAALIAVGIAVLLVAISPVAQSQVASPTAAPTSEKTFEGQLTKVDTAAKTISVKGTEDRQPKEMSFSYDDATQVIGGDKTVQGLTGKTGSDLKITYRVDRGANQAMKIEMVDKDSK
jgi:transcriptional accessory protein Tex/SPT6